MDTPNLFEQPFPDEGPEGGDPAGSATPGDTPGGRQLALVKSGHRYVFHYQPGKESELLDRLVSMARDSECSLGMFDAAVLSHQIGRRLSQQVEWMLKQSSSAA